MFLKLRPLILTAAIAVFFFPQASTSQPLSCKDRYDKISEYFYLYNERAAEVNAIMDRIAMRAMDRGVVDLEQVPPDVLTPSDISEWKEAIDDFVKVGQPMLQMLLEFREFGCTNDDNEGQLEQMIEAATDQLKLSRDRLNKLILLQ